MFILFETGAPLDRLSEATRKYAIFAQQNNNDLVYRVVRAEEQNALRVARGCRATSEVNDATGHPVPAVSRCSGLR